MSNPIKLVINRQAKTLVSVSGSVVTIPPLFQSNTQDFEVQIVDPSSNIATPFVAVDMAAFGLRLAIGPTPTGSAGGPTLLALQDTWSYDDQRDLFYASVDLNTAAVATYIGALPSLGAYFEINVTGSGNRITVLQTTCTLTANLDEGTTTSPSPADTYLTKAESLATFVPYQGNNGRTIVLKSPSGTYGRELGVSDDGSAIDNIILL